jgi:hypothetical protein
MAIMVMVCQILAMAVEFPSLLAMAQETIGGERQVTVAI